MNAEGILLGMAENNAWSNHRLLRACAALSDEDYRATRTSFFPSIRMTLSHNLIVDWYYVDALEGGTLGRDAFVREEPFDTLAPLATAQREVDARLVRFCATLTNDKLNAIVRLVREDRVQREKAGDVLLHLFEHQIHHRGQAHAMLAGTSVKPPQLDEFFLADEAPLRAGELAELGLRIR
jgi:uncharacterized damage-inducible protein DinB